MASQFKSRKGWLGHHEVRQTPPRPPMAFGNMREPGVRGLGVRRRFQSELFCTDAGKRPAQS
jgi:hypothetical protein